MSVCCCSAASMSCCQVTGFVMSRPACCATDLRYQSSCVFAQKGTATSLSRQVEFVIAACTTSSVVACATSSGTGARKLGLGELGDERRVEAHQVDRVVVGGEPPHELLTLGGGVTRQERRRDRVAAVRRLRAVGGDLLLAAGIGIDVPGQLRRPAVRAAGCQAGGGEDGDERGTEQAPALRLSPGAWRKRPTGTHRPLLGLVRDVRGEPDHIYVHRCPFGRTLRSRSILTECAPPCAQWHEKRT